jgi:hypothetical protein
MQMTLLISLPSPSLFVAIVHIQRRNINPPKRSQRGGLLILLQGSPKTVDRSTQGSQGSQGSQKGRILRSKEVSRRNLLSYHPLYSDLYKGLLSNPKRFLLLFALGNGSSPPSVLCTK